MEHTKASPHPARDARHPLPQAGEGKQESLTERARALYEESVVPVAEIARICGVSERTIYKYAQKENWKPRYRWIAGEAGVRHRRWRAPPKFAPAKGVGARFIRREDMGRAFPVGLKANDPAAAARASADCMRAQAVAQEATRRAARERAAEKTIETIAAVGVTLREIAAWRRAQQRKREREQALRAQAARSGRDAGRIVSRNGMLFIERPKRVREAEHAGESEMDLRAASIERALWVAAAMALTRWEGMAQAAKA